MNGSLNISSKGGGIIANPQVADGFTRIANELMNEIMLANLTGTQLKILLCILRYTYGYQRKEYKLSSKFMEEKINIHEAQIRKELKKLIDRNIVFVVRKEKSVNVLQLNKNHEEWIKRDKPVPVKNKPKTSIGLPKKEKNNRKYDTDSQYYKMACHFYNKIKPIVEENNIGPVIAKSDMQNWANEFRIMVEVNDIDPEQLMEVINWVVTDDFWKTNILSPAKLKKQYVQLVPKMNKEMAASREFDEEQRNFRKEIAFNEFVTEGHDPEDFNWDTGKGKNANG